MSGAPSFTLFTYSPDVEPLEARWRDDGIGDAFFGNAGGARAAIFELRDAVADEPGHDWPAMRLERIETVPVTADSDVKPAGIPINIRPPFRFEAGHDSNQLPAGFRH